MLRNKVLNLLIIFLFLLPFKIFSANVQYNAEFTVGYYDNVNLINQPIVPENSKEVGAGLTVLEDSAAFYADFRAELRYIDYKKDIAPDESEALMFTNLIWKIRPGQFFWILDNNFTQAVIDPLISDTASNRQNVNVFSTGPDYIARINSTNNFTVEARVQKYSFEEGADNNRIYSAARWLYTANSSLMFSLNDEALS